MKTSGPGQEQASTSAPERPVRPPVPPLVPDHDLLRKIGGGSYGEVWLARNVVGTLRAVKIVYRHDFSEAYPFEREFKGIQKFEPVSRTHDGLVDILQIGRNDKTGHFYYVMELADDAAENPKEIRNSNVEIETPQGPVRTSGFEIPSSLVISNSDLDSYTPRTLRSDLKSHGRLPVEKCIQLGLFLSSALEHLHRSGLVHRDIKPSNIIFVQGAPKLADIGLVADVAEARSFVGTIGFIAPEGPGSAQADVYSLGKVLYEIFTGKDRQDFPALPEEFRNSVDPRLREFNQVILRACEGDPRLRYPSAQAMHDDLASVAAGKSTKGPRLLQKRWAMARKVGAVTAVLMALLLASSAFVILFKYARNPDPEAVRLFELGRWHQQKLTDENLKQAVKYLQEAIQRDPAYVEPYTALVGIYTWKVSWLSDEETLQRIKQIAAKLLSLNPNLAEGHMASSYAKYLEGDWAGVESEMRLALQLNPNFAQAHTFSCYYLSLLGRVKEAAEHGRRAQELDPTSRIAATIAGYPYITARQYDRAIAQFRKALELEDFPLAHQWIAKALEAKGDYLAALAEFEKNAILSGADETKARQRFEQIREAYTNSGPRGYWEKVLEIQLAAGASNEKPKVAEQDRWSLDGVYAQLGETNKALELLEHDIEGPADGSWLKLEPLYEPLRDHPRFKALLKRAGLER